MTYRYKWELIIIKFIFTDSTALHVASREGHRDIVECLCAHGANPNLQNYIGIVIILYNYS